MKMRKKLSKKASKKNFRRGALSINGKNTLRGTIMRGGYRL